MSTLFTIYDYIFCAFVLFFAFVGLVRGFWVQLFSIAIWSAGFIFYCFYAPTFEHGFLSAYMSANVAHWFAVAIILVGACIINFIARFLLNSIFKINPFTVVNKVGGFLLGACSSSLIVLLVIYALNNSPLAAESTDWEKSYTVKQATPILASLKEHNDNKTSFAAAATAANNAVSQVINTTGVA